MFLKRNDAEDRRQKRRGNIIKQNTNGKEMKDEMEKYLKVKKNIDRLRASNGMGRNNDTYKPQKRNERQKEKERRNIKEKRKIENRKIQGKERI